MTSVNVGAENSISELAGAPENVTSQMKDAKTAAHTRSPTLSKTFDRRVDTLRFQRRSKSIGRRLGHAPAPAATHAARLDTPAIAGVERTQGVPSGPLRVPHSAPSLYGAAATEDDDYDPAVVQCGERRRCPTSHRTSLPQLRELQLGLRRNRLLRTLWSRGAQCQCLRQDQKYYMQFAPIPLSI